MLDENKTVELKDEELEKVSGGDNDNNPLGLIPGDSVKFYYDIIDQWIWGEFKYYYDGKYRVRWDDTTIIYGLGVQSLLVEADETEVPESLIRFN